MIAFSMIGIQKLNLLPTALVACLVGLLGLWVGTTHGARPDSWGELEATALTQEFDKRFGARKNSEYDEERILREFFRERRNGVFVDIGASHYRHLSNTYFLETALGWSGVAVDPLGSLAADYAKYRPRTKFVPLFVSDRSHEAARLFVNPRHQIVSSSTAEFTRRWGENASPQEVRTITMDDLLQGVGIKHFDFLNMDIELSEPRALAGFSILEYRPALACVEAHQEVRQEILDYFAARGYVLVGRYLRVDSLNLWFRPLTQTQDAG